MIKRVGLEEDWLMIVYLLALILILGVPFLLYCLWNFARELKPHRSTAVLTYGSPHRHALRVAPTSRFRSQPSVVHLRDEGHAVS